MNTWRLCEWNSTARRGLLLALNERECGTLIEDQVKAGSAQLWRVSDHSWLVTEVLLAQSELFLWCHQGRDSEGVIQECAAVAAAHGLTWIGWFTRHKGAKRVFRKYAPEVSESDGEYRFRINVEHFNGNFHLTTGRARRDGPQRSAGFDRRRHAV